MTVHHEVSVLLPWYVNGTLNEQEMATVAAHLRACPACREAAAADVREARWLHDDGVETRVAALAARRGREFEALRRRIRGLNAPHRYRRSRMAAVAMALALIAFAIPFTWLSRPQPAVYELRTTRVAAEAPVLQLAFRDGTSATDVELLIRASGTPLGAPSAHGIYRIALVTDDPQALLERIRNHPAVRWAEIEL